MAESLCARRAAPTPSPTAWTPAHHVRVTLAKPVRLLELGTGPHGKMVRVEFPDGWSRTIDLMCEADAWHPLFSSLPDDDIERLHAHMAVEPVRQADGTYLQRWPLSFTTKRLNRRCKHEGCNAFDVPAQTTGDGDVTGYRCAAELLRALSQEHGPSIHVLSILQEAVRATAEGRGVPSRRAAAHTFLDVVAEALTFMAKNKKHQEFMAQKIAISEAHAAHWAAYVARDRAQFVQRMQDGRRKKREARAAGGAA